MLIIFLLVILILFIVSCIPFGQRGEPFMVDLINSIHSIPVSLEYPYIVSYDEDPSIVYDVITYKQNRWHNDHQCTSTYPYGPALW